MDDTPVDEDGTMRPLELVDQLQRLRAGRLFDVDSQRHGVAEIMCRRKRGEQPREAGGPVVGDDTDL